MKDKIYIVTSSWMRGNELETCVVDTAHTFEQALKTYKREVTGIKSNFYDKLYKGMYKETDMSELETYPRTQLMVGFCIWDDIQIHERTLR